MIDLKLIEEITNAFGVSGCEGEVRNIVRKHITKNVDDIRVDALGNLIAYKKAKGIKPGAKKTKVMLAAHINLVFCSSTRWAGWTIGCCWLKRCWWERTRYRE